MCCFVLVLGFLGPRIALLWAWVFTPRVTEAFGGSLWWPLVGLVLLPWTTLAFVAAWAPTGGVSGIGWVVLGLGLVLDVATYAGRAAGDRVRPA